MKEIIVSTQEELDTIRIVAANECVRIVANLNLNFRLDVFGELFIESKLDFDYLADKTVNAWGNSNIEAWENSRVVAWENSSVEAWENSSVEARGNSRVVARENSRVVAWENSSVVAWENSSVVARGISSVEAWENSSVEARGNSRVVARENSRVVAWGNSNIEARENSSVVAWENSSVEAWENSSVEARGISSVEAWGNCVVRLFSEFARITLFGFSVCFEMVGGKIEMKSETCTVIKPRLEKGVNGWLEREGIQSKEGQPVILFKRVSKDFLTQEKTCNKTKWTIGETLEHPDWNPKHKECGPGKYHACSRPYFCNDFRNVDGDRYVAIEVETKDLHVWDDNAEYPHKIAFRKGKVLFECDYMGNKK